MRAFLLAVCLLPFLTAAQADHRTLADACILAAATLVSGKHTSTVKAVGTGNTPDVRLEIKPEAENVSLTARCSFVSDEPPFGIARVCVANACYSESANFKSRRKTFEEVSERLSSLEH